MPLDGSAPPTTWTDFKDAWVDGVELESGDVLIREGLAAFVRVPKAGGVPSPPIKMDAGRPVSHFELVGTALPGDRGVFVNLVAYDARGWHYSVGVMDVRTGKVKVVEEDGGNARLSPTGHMLFSRGDAVLAVPFDPGGQKTRGAPVAVWSGLSARFTFLPAAFSLTDDGALFYRPGQSGGDRTLAFVDAAGKLEPWSSERRAVDGPPEPSPDGRRFACSIANARGIDELWVSDVAHPAFRRLGTDPNADCFWPLWSPDGRRIAYQRRGGDDRDGVYVQDADGGAATRILKTESPDVRYAPFGWRPDGSALLLWQTAPGRDQLMLLPLSSGESDSSRLRVLLPSASHQFTPRLSRDGRLVAYAGDESGKLQAYVAELRPDGSTGRPVEVRTSGCVTHQWSPDGRALFVEDERHRIMRVSVTMAPELSVSAPTEVYDLETLRGSLWNVFPDGRFFVGLKNENEEEIRRYDLVLNWTAELKKRMRGAR
jgi:Tol biopolymer transport system component